MPLVAPRSVAVVGASPNTSKGPGRIIPLLEESGFDGPIYPVNPKYPEINDRICYPTVSGLPQPVDLVVIMVPAVAALQAARDSAESGARFAVIMSSGFGEVGGDGVAMQEELTEITRRTGMRIYGPNCPGLFVIKDRRAISFSPRLAMADWRPGRTALITQGGAMGRAVIDAMEAHGSPGLNYWFSPGNEADLGAADFLGWLAQDDGTDMVLLILESFRDGGRFMDAARLARAAGKPVAVLKIGRSDAGVRATATHTAAMAGADTVVDAALEQCGVIRVDDVDELVDLARIVERYGVREVANVGVCSLSGGSAALLADVCGVHGLRVGLPTPATIERMRELLPPLAAVGNPVDLTTEIFRQPELVSAALRTFLDDDLVDAAVMPFPYHLGPINDVMADNLVMVAQDSPKPVVAVGGSESVLINTAATILRQARVPFVPSATKAVLALERYARLARTQGGEQETATAVVSEIALERSATLLAGKTGTLTEQQSEEILRCYGIDFASSEIASTLDDAIASARRIGYPVVLKAAGEGVAHKSDAGLVRVGIEDVDALTAAYEDITTKYRRVSGREQAPVKVAQLVADGLETICGIVVDPSFGPVVTFGLGGVYAEILGDVAMRVCPIEPDVARALVGESKAYPILEGARGGPKLDIDALAETLSRLSRFAHDWSHRLRGVDINPLRIRTSGVIGLDALIVLDEQ